MRLGLPETPALERGRRPKTPKRATQLARQAGVLLVARKSTPGRLKPRTRPNKRTLCPCFSNPLQYLRPRTGDDPMPTTTPACLFCQLHPDAILLQNDLAFAIRDGFPVTPLHTLVIPKRHAADYFSLTREELMACDELLRRLREMILRDDPSVAGFNIGINAGAAAGQTIFHCHLHLIPRRPGDVPNPRGGVRHIIPGRGSYPGGTENEAELCTGHPNDPFLLRLLPDLPGAREVDILAAFVQDSGVDLVEQPLLAVVRAGAAVRILCGDYLGISAPGALRRLLALTALADPSWPPRAGIALRVIELERLGAGAASFHPKAWRILRADGAVVWVGSSNLSYAALRGGVEWNLRATSASRPDACRAVAVAFQALWEQATRIDGAWIEAYARRPRASSPERLAPDPEPAQAPLEPWPWQRRALEQLQALRRMGHRRALAAVATGMGKTVLAALDAGQVAAAVARRPRFLVIAHRAEILAQTAGLMRRVLQLPAAAETWCLGNSADLSGRLVLASIQKLARPEVLARLEAQHFDYAVVDEVHHAEAPTWRRVLSRLDAGFTLGLTATPERADGRDVAAIFDDVLACQIGIGEGIADGILVPFAYRGLKDDVDYDQIPWRSGRFDPDELERQVMHSRRMDRLWAAWTDTGAERSLVFCCSRRHARFVCEWLTQRGVRAAAVFSGEGSDDRAASLRSLADGRLQALCTVDLFNEGLDLPGVDRVVMLRPTESSVVFTQQLGRGLRRATDKPRLTVIDFVGNHRIFGWRLRHLMALCGLEDSALQLRRLIAGEPLRLPPGCLIDVELEAKALLERLLPRVGQAVVEQYRALREEFGRRPTPLELTHRGMLPATLRREHDSWFEFVAAEGDLSELEREALARHGDWLRWVETTSITKSYKLVVLRVLIDADALLQGQDLIEHARKARSYMLAHPSLREDLQPNEDIKDHAAADLKDWAAWWTKWSNQRADEWLSVSGGRILNRLRVEEDLVAALVAMSAELIDWRLGEYVVRRLQPFPTAGFAAKVSHSSGNPILFLPTLEEVPGRPVGPTSVRLPDGQSWEFRFVKVACNVAHPVGETRNRLPELLRTWFGARTGLPGTIFRVRFAPSGDGWAVEPEAAVAETPPVVARVEGCPSGMKAHLPEGSDPARWVPVMDLAAAAGMFSEAQVPEPMGWLEVKDRAVAKGAFVAQVRGRSMEPTIPDGAWGLFRPVVPGSRQGRVLLVQHRGISDPETGGTYTVKRYRSQKESRGETWRHIAIALEPDNPEFSAIPIDPMQVDELRIIAEFVGVIG